MEWGSHTLRGQVILTQNVTQWASDHFYGKSESFFLLQPLLPWRWGRWGSAAGTDSVDKTKCRLRISGRAAVLSRPPQLCSAGSKRDSGTNDGQDTVQARLMPTDCIILYLVSLQVMLLES